MPEVDGFQMLKKLESIPIVIFCTAYDQYSLQAFETNSIDYLLKPVSTERLQQTVNKLQLFSKTDIAQNINKLLRELSSLKEVKKMTSLTVKKGEKLIFIKLEDVSYFKAEERYVLVFAKDKKYVIENTLSQLEKKLPDNFIRVHRGIVINKNFVSDIQKYFNSRFIITLNDKKATSVTSGRSYNEAIKSWIH
jgi:two-component system LytT family response regulator